MARCVSCGEIFTGTGHNPAPIWTSGEVCDRCNMLIIISRLEYALDQIDGDDA